MPISKSQSVEEYSALIYYVDDYVSVRKIEFLKNNTNVGSSEIKTKINVKPDSAFFNKMARKVENKFKVKFNKIKVVNDHFVIESKECIIHGYISPFKFNGSQAARMNFTIVSDSDKISSHKVKRYIEKNFLTNTVKGITWAYSTSRGTQYKSMNVEKNEFPVFSCYYPKLKTDINSYFDDYMKSNSSVMVLLGPPGTGKTTFIRELIMNKELNALVTYDKSLINSDSFFMDFMDSDEYDTLIIEDADTILNDRKNSGNDLMDKFLNASDGLIKSPNKKIIFSTNLENISDVDEALIRPGRCFDVMEFDTLSYENIKNISNEISLELDLDKFDKNSRYTVAEIFNSEYGDYSENVDDNSTGIGFHRDLKD